MTGAFTKFDIGSVVPSGGDLIAIGNLTVDGASGPDDLTVFVMRTGAVVLYAGTDPSDAANWSIQGVWNTGNPVGRRCLVPFAEDLILITNTGFISLLSFTSGNRTPISDTINPTVSDAARVLGTNYGWHGIYHPKERQLLFNIPTLELQQSDQYVMNTLYRPWCRFRGWNAITSAIRNDDLYMGLNGKVIVANDSPSSMVRAMGQNDSGENINGFVQTAWNYLGLRGREKHFKQYRPNIRSDALIEIGLSIGTDFQTPSVSVPQSIGTQVGAQWDVSEWDVGEWSTGIQNSADWRNAGDLGYNISISYTTRTNSAAIELLATDLIYEIGSPV